jgi:hypothetical protein
MQLRSTSCHLPKNDGDPPIQNFLLPDARSLYLKESNDKVVIGLRIYTNKDVTCAVEGRLKTGCKDPNCKDCTHPTTLTFPAETIAATVVTAA